MNSNECENELQRPSQFINEGGWSFKILQKKIEFVEVQTVNKRLVQRLAYVALT
jgi:hypothetical protein